MVDVRREDQQLLEEHGCYGFVEVWEKELHRIHHQDQNQERWHLARMAMLAGYLIGQGNSVSEVVETLRDHQEGSDS
jgi:hypothetical protein